MRTSRRVLLALALAALACAAHALELVAPANGTTLRGGSFAALEWRSAKLPHDAEEWEAFLSVDGGSYYAFRITPHLEIDRQRFTFIVPNVDARNARILIRVGNEIEETEYELPGAFAIARDRKAGQLVRSLFRFGRGEAARPGDRAVMAWTDGARDGSGLIEEWSETAPPAPFFVHVSATQTEDAEPTNPGPAREASVCIASARRSHRDEHTHSGAQPLLWADLLLLGRRRNI